MPISIIPKPVYLEQTRGFFTLDAQTAIVADEAVAFQAEQLRGYLSPATGFSFKGQQDKTIELRLKDSSKLGQEGYTLQVTPKRILLSAANSAGLFYADSNSASAFAHRNF